MLPSSPAVRRLIVFEGSPSSWVTVEIMESFLNAINPSPVPIHKIPLLSITIVFRIIPERAETFLKTFLVASYLIRPVASHPLSSNPEIVQPVNLQGCNLPVTVEN